MMERLSRKNQPECSERLAFGWHFCRSRDGRNPKGTVEFMNN